MDCNNYYAFNFDESDNSPINIDTSYMDNLWQIGVSGKFEPSHSSHPLAISIDTISAYTINNYSSFELAIFGWFQNGLDIGFDHMFDTEHKKDGCMLEFYNFTKEEWLSLYELPENSYYFNGYLVEDSVTSLGGPGFSGTSDKWDDVHFIYWPVSQDPDTVKIRFVFASDSIDTQQKGWIIDNILIGGIYEGIQESGYNRLNSSVYPNPVSSSMIIEFDNPEHKSYQLTIYDNLGKQVQSIVDVSGNQVDLSVQQYRSGLYYYKLLNEEEKEGSWGKFLVE